MRNNSWTATSHFAPACRRSIKLTYSSRNGKLDYTDRIIWFGSKERDRNAYVHQIYVYQDQEMRLDTFKLYCLGCHRSVSIFIVPRVKD